MKKRLGLIISVVAICVLLSAAYIFYSKSNQKADTAGQQTKTTESTSQQTTTVESTSGKTREFAKDFDLKDLNGKEYKLSDYKGKIVIMTFWEVRCSYCKQEIPILNEMYEEFKDQDDVAFLAICSAEKDETVRKYLTDNELTLNVPLDTDAKVYYDYGTKVIPNNYILNKDGSVYDHIIGPISKDQIYEAIDNIRNGKTSK